jgi:hypothetical protein
MVGCLNCTYVCRVSDRLTLMFNNSCAGQSSLHLDSGVSGYRAIFVNREK